MRATGGGGVHEGTLSAPKHTHARPPPPLAPRVLRSLNAERAAGEARVAEEKAAVEAKLERVRTALAERYEAGFKPLLAEAEARHADELRRIVDLQVRSVGCGARSVESGVRNVAHATAWARPKTRSSGTEHYRTAAR